MALKFSITIPISSASTEISFACLKLVKTILRTTLSQERFEHLLIISCEKGIGIEKDDITSHFTQKNSVLKKLLIM